MSSNSPLSGDFRFPNVWEMDFETGDRGDWARQVCEELKDQPSLMNADAPVMEANGLHEHKFRRENEFDNTARPVAMDEGFTTTDNPVGELSTAEMGLVSNAKEFDHKQERFADNGPEYRTRVMQKTVRSLNKIDDVMLVNGGHDSNPKEYNGLRYFTGKKTNVNYFEKKLYSDEIPFVGNDECLCLGNDDEAQNSTGINVVLSDASKAKDDFASLYFVVWGTDTVCKLIPKGQMGYAGIVTEVLYNQARDYTDKLDGIRKKLIYDFVGFEKATGLAVLNRFGVMRIANINCNLTGLSAVDELKRIEYNASRIENYLSHVGLFERVKCYGSSQLVQFMQRARTNNVTQVNVSVNGDNTGKPNGLTGKFILNDSFAVEKEPSLNRYESFVS